jgi:hypothetical protein
MEILFDFTVLAVNLTGKLVRHITESRMMIAAVMNNEINADHLQ